MTQQHKVRTVRKVPTYNDKDGAESLPYSPPVAGAFWLFGFKSNYGKVSLLIPLTLLLGNV